ncbi:hypothetical protein FQN57_001112 [Myotisia sp. PD_48]|nr:hypothetical protein FQN57_001112 [Myotisia sp. PD_48]
MRNIILRVVLTDFLRVSDSFQPALAFDVLSLLQGFERFIGPNSLALSSQLSISLPARSGHAKRKVACYDATVFYRLSRISLVSTRARSNAKMDSSTFDHRISILV